MNRRIFLKALCISPLVPSVLCAKAREPILTATEILKRREEVYGRYAKHIGECYTDAFYDAWKKVMHDTMIYGQGGVKFEDGKFIHLTPRQTNNCIEDNLTI